MSFGSLVSKLVKQGKSKEAATKIAGAVANAKMKGAGSGPTAKQKARAKGSAATMKVSDSRFKEIVKELKGASKMHLKQSKDLAKMSKGNSPLDLKDACYKKVKAQYKVFPSAYASGAIAKCRKNKGKK